MIQLIKGNCMEEMKNLPYARLLLTDIPYNKVHKTSNGLRKISKGKADVLTFEIIDFLNEIYNRADIFIIFCGKEQISEIYEYFNNKQENGKGTVRQLVWCKTNPSPMNGEYVYLSSTENAVWFKKKGTGKLNNRCKKNYFIYPTGSSRYHPTEKNHKLLKELIVDNTKENDLVIDCCMGGGSTGIVAINNKRNFIGIELDDEYYEIAKNRIKEEQNESIQ